MKATMVLPGAVTLLEAALEGLVCANQVLIRAELVPPSPIDASVKYQHEASGLEEWNIASRVIDAGWGDCEDLNAWEVAGLRETGEDKGARVRIIRTGRKRYHCVGELSDGTIVDVCPELGMTKQPKHTLPVTEPVTPPSVGFAPLAIFAAKYAEKYGPTALKKIKAEYAKRKKAAAEKKRRREAEEQEDDEPEPDGAA